MKITIDRSTVERALDALQAGPDVDPIFAGQTEDALRAALARPLAKQLRPSDFAKLIKDKETLTGIPVYWAEWPNKEEA
jgi:hypothetical protein